MTYSESALLPASYHSLLVEVVRAEDHPLQPIKDASTYVVKSFASEEDAQTFVKETFGLARIGFRRYLLKAGDRVAWRAPGATVSEDRLFLGIDYEGYPDRTAALRAHDLPKPSLTLDDLGVSSLLHSPVDAGCPGPVVVDGCEEYEVEKIVDEIMTDLSDKDKGTRRYRIRWKGWSAQGDSWILAKDAEPLEALDRWLEV
ncbi:hypothetical protein BKA70DRAFT_1423407 [Coprinopsis sp. MPI-PUGE-AT-0042]|nr:hypothetical protein BKA70DRAFT_1423407 [Coprinopsis sp. MPI-PUGE-AT-0042]